MGFLSRIKTTTAFNSLEQEVIREATMIAQQFSNLEPFEVLLRVWDSQMRRRGQVFLAENGEHIIHLWAVTPDGPAAMELLARHIAAYVLPGFQETTMFAELEAAMDPIISSMKADNGARFNRAFAHLNPRSHDTFVKKHQREPFTPVDPRQFDEALRYR